MGASPLAIDVISVISVSSVSSRKVERKVEDSTETEDSTKVEDSTETEDSTNAGAQEWGTERMTVRRRDAAPEPTWTYSRRVSSTVPRS